MKTFLQRALLSLIALFALSTASAQSYTLPFSFQASQSTFEECTVIDVNGDENPNDKNYFRGIWTYNSQEKVFKYTASIENNADDWLILPAVDCGSATSVKISFNVKTGSDPESFEVCLGNEASASSMTVPVISKNNYSNSKGETLEATVNLPKGGSNSWHIGFHASSGAFTYYIYISDIKMEAASGEVVAPVVPAAPAIKSSNMNYLDYTATVTMPSVDTEGNPISGEMSLKVLVDGNQNSTKTGLAAGSDVDVALNLAAGEHTVSYRAVLGDQESELVSETVTAEVHVITPQSPVIKESKILNLGYTATVTMPTLDTDGNTINPRMSLKTLVDGTVVKTSNYLSPGDDVNVELSLEPGSHTIGFVAVLSGVDSAPATETVEAKEAEYALPFDFAATQATFDECKVVDANGDGSTWSYNKAFVYTYNSRNNGDDWLFLPFVDFGSTTKVKVSVDVMTGGYDEAFEIKLGSDRTIAAMSVPVMKEEAFQSREVKTLTAEVEVPAGESSKWCLGIHAISKADQYELSFSNIRIESAETTGTVAAAPVIAESAVENLAYTATVTMPSLDVNGAELTANMNLEVLVDGEVAETKENLAPGAEVEIALALEEGPHTIGYRAVIDGQAGETASEEVTASASVTATGDLPYDFAGTKDNFDQCVVVDVNGDAYVSNGNTFGGWSFAMGAGFKYVYSQNNDADDWLILPLVNFGDATKVKVSVDVKTESDTESFEIMLGRERTVEAMTVEVMKHSDFKQYGSFTTLTAEVTLPAAAAPQSVANDAASDNSWALGIHATSPKFHYNLYVNNIRIEAVATTTAIDEIEAEENDVECEYYNLQGVRVINPQSGIYIVRKGSKVSKVIL